MMKSYLNSFARRTPLVAASFLALGLQALYADITVVMDESGDIRTLYYKSGIGAEYLNSKLDTLIDLSSDKFTSFNHNHKVYAEAKVSEIPQVLGDTLKEQMGAISENPMVQLMIEQQKLEASKAKIEVQKQSSEAIAGYASDSWVILNNGKPIKELKTSKDLEEAISKEFDFAKFRRLMNQVEDTLQTLLPPSPADIAERKLKDEGFVVFSAEPGFMGQDSMEISEKLISVSKEAIPAQIFKKPVGYRQISLIELFQLESEEPDEDDGEEEDYEEDYEEDLW